VLTVLLTMYPKATEEIAAPVAATLGVYTHASGSAQRDAVNPLEEQLFLNIPTLESCGIIAKTERQLVQ